MGHFIHFVEGKQDRRSSLGRQISRRDRPTYDNPIHHWIRDNQRGRHNAVATECRDRFRSRIRRPGIWANLYISFKPRNKEVDDSFSFKLLVNRQNVGGDFHVMIRQHYAISRIKNQRALTTSSLVGEILTIFASITHQSERDTLVAAGASEFVALTLNACRQKF